MLCFLLHGFYTGFGNVSSTGNLQSVDVIARGTPKQLRELHAGLEAVEYFGPQTALDEIAAKATAAGLKSRRAGLSISVLGVESADQHLLDSWGRHSRRPTNLEDVFVLLTGESLDA